MEQMQAIWSALDEMMEQDPKKYEEFIKSQIEAGRSAFASGSNQPSTNTTRRSDLSSILSSLAERNSEPKPSLCDKSKAKDEEQERGDNKSCSSKAQAVKPEKHESIVNAADVIKMKNLTNSTKLDVPVGGDADSVKKDGKPFELKLPIGIEPTKIKKSGTEGSVLIQEISSTETEDRNNWEDEAIGPC